MLCHGSVSRLHSRTKNVDRPGIQFGGHAVRRELDPYPHARAHPHTDVDTTAGGRRETRRG